MRDELKQRLVIIIDIPDLDFVVAADVNHAVSIQLEAPVVFMGLGEEERLFPLLRVAIVHPHNLTARIHVFLHKGQPIAIEIGGDAATRDDEVKVELFQR